MTVSSAMFVTPGEAPLFPRQERKTSSVRLRRRRDDVTAVRKPERHSGDFSSCVRIGDDVRLCEGADRSESEGEFNYISFPPGVVGLHGEGGGLTLAGELSPREEPNVCPVRLRGGEQCGPGESQQRRSHGIRDGSSREQHCPNLRKKEARAKRCSAEFKKGDRRSQDCSRLPQVACQELGKAEEQTLIERMVSREMGLRGGDTGSEGSEESGVFSTGSSQESSRRPGLGRRAVTQVEVRDRKNLYSRGGAKSQDDLVKVFCNSGSEDACDHASSILRAGLLWQQRDKLFSRWKERYFILTKDLLQGFKKTTSKISEMGEFIFKVKLSDVDSIELLDKRGYLTICLSIQREGKVYLRRTEGIRDWFNSIRENMLDSRTRRNNRVSAIFADRRQNTDSSGIESWMAQKCLSRLSVFSGSTPDISRGREKERITLDELSKLYNNVEEEEIKELKTNNKMNRLSIMSSGDPANASEGEYGFVSEVLERKSPGDTDSGHNSLHSSSNGTNSSTPREDSLIEEDEEDYTETLRLSPQIRIRPTQNSNIIEVRYRERCLRESQPTEQQRRRRSQQGDSLLITHV